VKMLLNGGGGEI